MAKMQSKVRAPLVQAPIAWVTRSILASHHSVQAVMAVDENGRVLAYERAADSDDKESVEGGDYKLLFFVPLPRVLFFLRLNAPYSRELTDRILRILEFPSFGLTS
jgi:hypothetical protein